MEFLCDIYIKITERCFDETKQKPQNALQYLGNTIYSTKSYPQLRG